MSSALSKLWYGPSGPTSTSVKAWRIELSAASRTSAATITSGKRGMRSGTKSRARMIAMTIARSSAASSEASHATLRSSR